MSLYRVETASVVHVKPLAARLREQDCRMLRSFGASPRAALRRAFAESRYCRTALIGCDPVAMWGYCAPALSDCADVWAALTDLAAAHPFAIVRRALVELKQMAARAGVLYARIDRGNGRAMLFAVSLGFRFCETCEDDRVLLMAWGEA